MPDHSMYIGKDVVIQVTNDGAANGFFGANYISQQSDGAQLRVSKGGQPATIVLPYARIVDITLA